mgnify:FL=1
MSYRTDRELVRAHATGDPAAFTDIVRKHGPQLYRVARTHTHNDQDAQDIVQEALLKAYRNLHRYRGESKLGTWLHRMTVNAAIDHLRRTSRKDFEVSIDNEEAVDRDRNASLAHDPLRALDSYMTVRNAVAALPHAQRGALLLIDVHGLSVEHAAKELGVKPGTVKSRRSRARSAVADQLLARG